MRPKCPVNQGSAIFLTPCIHTLDAGILAQRGFDLVESENESRGKTMQRGMEV